MPRAVPQLVYPGPGVDCIWCKTWRFAIIPSFLWPGQAYPMFLLCGFAGGPLSSASLEVTRPHLISRCCKSRTLQATTMPMFCLQSPGYGWSAWAQRPRYPHPSQGRGPCWNLVPVLLCYSGGSSSMNVRPPSAEHAHAAPGLGFPRLAFGDLLV